MYICFTWILIISYFVTLCTLHSSLLHLWTHSVYTCITCTESPGTYQYFLIYCILYFCAPISFRLINLYSHSLINYVVYTVIYPIVYITVMWFYALHLSIHIDSNTVVFYIHTPLLCLKLHKYIVKLCQIVLCTISCCCCKLKRLQ